MAASTTESWRSGLRDAARKCRFAHPRRELLGLARRYEGQAKVIEGRARRQ
jgi:hypothetical protein